MKIAVVNQPMDMIVKPHQNSIGIWTYETARRVADRHPVLVVGKRSPAQRECADHEAVEYRFVPPLVPNRRLIEVLDRVGDATANEHLPAYASRLAYLDYGVQAALVARRQGVDIVHIHNFSQFVPTVRALCPNVKIVLHMHCEWLNQLDASVIDRRLQSTDLIVGSSDYITARAAAAFPEHADRCVTIYNGVDADRFGPPNDGDPVDAGPAATRSRLLYVGRVSPEKGVHDLVEAFTLIADEDPDVHLDIAGPQGSLPREFLVDVDDDPAVRALGRFYDDGPDYEAQLRQLIPEHLTGRVHFLGALPQAELVDLYRRSALVINPSYSEAFGMSLVEAMACGTPVVATRVGGMAGIVGDDREVGFLVDRGDVRGLADAVLELLRDADLRLSAGHRGRRLVEERFTWERIATSLVHEYERILGGPSA